MAAKRLCAALFAAAIVEGCAADSSRSAEQTGRAASSHFVQPSLPQAARQSEADVQARITAERLVQAQADGSGEFGFSRSSQAGAAAGPKPGDGLGLPPAGRPGVCYARVAADASGTAQAATEVMRPVLCRAQLRPELVRRLQTALLKAGYSPGKIDGVFGAQTLQALNQFQTAQGLPVDAYVNLVSLQALGLPN